MQNWQDFPGNLLKPLIQIKSFSENTRSFLLQQDLDGLPPHSVIMEGLNYRQEPFYLRVSLQEQQPGCKFGGTVGGTESFLMLS